MNGLARTWAALSVAKRAILGVVVSAVIALTILLAQVAQRPTLSLLYAGLEQRVAGDVVVQLEQMGIQNEIRGTSIYVPEADRDRVRMALAAMGMPSNGHQGYELLDNLSGFGTTAEMFDAAYWRAKEGELARTLLAASGVRQARVHIGTPRRQTFARNRAVPTASITLSAAGGTISAETAMAARYLVANAIPGLQPNQVAVIDSDNGIVLKPGEETSPLAPATESDRATKLKADLEDLLAARVGIGRARVSVNVETTHQTESISRRTVDPESRALRQSDTVEMSESGEDSGGAVTVASNLPDGDASGNNNSSSQREETRKTDKYDYTETREEIVRPAGAVSRISVAILLDQIRETAADGTVTMTPRPAEEMKALEKLVKSTIGFDEKRGDLVTLESISFAELPQDGTTATAEDIPSFVEQNMMQLIQLGALAFVILILGLFVVRPILSGRRETAARLENNDPALSAIDVTPPAQAGAAQGSAQAQGLESAAQPGAKSEATQAAETLDPIEMLRNAVGNQADESITVLKGWLEAEPSTGASR